MNLFQFVIGVLDWLNKTIHFLGACRHHSLLEEEPNVPPARTPLRRSYSGFQLDEVHARNPVSLRNRVSQYLTSDENRYKS